MSNFIPRELSKHERWVAGYEALVASLADGYGMSITSIQMTCPAGSDLQKRVGK